MQDQAGPQRVADTSLDEAGAQVQLLRSLVRSADIQAQIALAPDARLFLGPTLLAGLSKHVDLNLVDRKEFGSGMVAMRYLPEPPPV